MTSWQKAKETTDQEVARSNRAGRTTCGRNSHTQQSPGPHNDGDRDVFVSLAFTFPGLGQRMTIEMVLRDGAASISSPLCARRPIWPTCRKTRR